MDAAVTALTLPLTALATGFLGSLHCLGMCGGISGTIALAAGKPDAPQVPAGSSIAISIDAIGRARSPARASLSVGASVFAFNTGRILSYAIAGAIAGGAAGLLRQTWLFGESFDVRAALFLFANLMVVLTGLYLMGLPQLLAPLERAGGALWRRLSPLTRALLPMDTPIRAATFGALWGWIPCGLVYATLLTAMTAGGAGAGALTMFAFGIGTMPAMLFAGAAAGGLRRWTRDSRVRLAAGAMIVALGLFGFARAGALASLRAFGALCISLVQATP